MSQRRLLLIVLVLLSTALPGSAQEVIAVGAVALDQHVAHRVDPVYPPIAKAARIQGTVVFEVRIGVTGKIESTKVVSGPAMLQQAAIDCLKQWTYRPFEKDGNPVVASGPVSIEFNLGKDAPTPEEDKIADRYFPLDRKCKNAVLAKTDSSAAAKVCKEAAETAEEFAPDVRFIEKRSAFVYAAYALEMSGDLKTALAFAGKAIDVVKLGHDDNSGSNAAYGIRGIIEGKLGELTSADRDLSVAEDFERKAIAWADSVQFEHGDSYKQALVQDLRFHAQVLQGLNRPDEAQKKLDEAAKYN